MPGATALPSSVAYDIVFRAGFGPLSSSCFEQAALQVLVPQRESGPCFDLWRVRVDASTGTRRATAAARTLLAQPGTRMYSGNAAALGVQLTCAGRARAAHGRRRAARGHSVRFRPRARGVWRVDAP